MFFNPDALSVTKPTVSTQNGTQSLTRKSHPLMLFFDRPTDW